MSAAMPSPADKGLARERTVLAWNRSGLAAVVAVAILLRHVWPLSGTAQVVALGLISAAAIVWAVALLGFATGGNGEGQGTLLRSRAFALITAGTVLLGVAGFVLAFFPPD
jgi:hypothetical protein